MILYIENSKDTTKNIVRINIFCKVAGYEINIQNLFLLYTHNELAERKVKQTIPFTIASKTIKYLGINLSKKVKDLYTKDCKTLMKEI